MNHLLHRDRPDDDRARADTPLEQRLRAEARALHARHASADPGLAGRVIDALEREPDAAATAASDAPPSSAGARDTERRAARDVRGLGWLAAAAAVLVLSGTRGLWLDAPPPPASVRTDPSPEKVLAGLGLRMPGLSLDGIARAVPPAAAVGEGELRARVEEPLRTELANLRSDGRRAFGAVLRGLPDPLGRLFSGG